MPVPTFRRSFLLSSSGNSTRTYRLCWPGSSVIVATDYELVGPGSNPGVDGVQTGPGAHPASCKMGTGSFPGVMCSRGVLLTTHPLLVPRSWKSSSMYLYPLSGPHRACNGITLPLPFFTCRLQHTTQTHNPQRRKSSVATF